MKVPTPNEVIDNAVGPYDAYAMGYANPMAVKAGESDGSGYIATMKVSVATVEMAGLDWGTQSIVSYDRCETTDANIGQINMETASSFCGLNGALWGLNLATIPTPTLLANSRDLFSSDETAALTAAGVELHNMQCYDGGPLLTATERLFGHVGDAERRNPPLPGSHVVCANKSATVVGPAYAWAMIAVAVPEDPSKAAHLFIEDCDTITPNSRGQLPTPEEVHKSLLQTRDSVLKSIVLCGQDYQSVKYTKAYIAGKAIYASKTQVACALACAPYIQMPRDSVFRAVAKPHELAKMSLKTWEDRVWRGQKFTPSPTGKDGILVIGPTPAHNGRARTSGTRRQPARSRARVSA